MTQIYPHPYSDIVAKVPQLYSNFSNKSTGQLAFLTFMLNFAGSLARLGTVLFESDDMLFRLQYITGAVLNTLMIIQFALYWNSPANADAPKKVQPTPKAGKRNKLE